MSNEKMEKEHQPGSNQATVRDVPTPMGAGTPPESHCCPLRGVGHRESWEQPELMENVIL